VAKHGGRAQVPATQADGRRELGEMLRRQRRSRGQTQNQAAAIFGRAQSTYHRWETGEHAPEPEQLRAIADYVGLGVDEVLELVYGGEEQPELDEPSVELRLLRAEVRALREFVSAVVAGAAAALEERA
jgi:transcriptional regulator with XRE-family HTH domain